MNVYRRLLVLYAVIIMTHIVTAVPCYSAVVVKRVISSVWQDASNVTIIDKSIYFNSIMQSDEVYWIYSGEGLGDLFVPDDIELITSSLNSPLEDIPFRVLIVGPQDATHPRYNSFGARHIGTSLNDGILLSATRGRIIGSSKISGNCWRVELNSEAEIMSPIGTISLNVGGNILGYWHVNGIDPDAGAGSIKANNISQYATITIAKSTASPISCILDGSGNGGNIDGTIYLSDYSGVLTANNINSSATITMNSLSGSIRANGNIDGTIDIGTVNSTGVISADNDNNESGDITGSVSIDVMYGNIHGASLHTLDADDCGDLNNINFMSGSKICGVAIDECNGNGRPDACDITTEISSNCNSGIGNTVPDECEVMGSFGYTGPSYVNASSKALRALAIADFDNDGDSDIVATNYADNKVVLLRNDGLGSFSPVETPKSPLSHASMIRPAYVAVGNFNNDKDSNGKDLIDFAVTTYGNSNDGGKVVIFWNYDGDWDFASLYLPPTVITVPNWSSTAMQIVPAVLSSNGGIDLVVGNFSRGEIAVLKAVLQQDGTYSYSDTPVVISTGSARRPVGLVAADFDNDGDIDVAFADRGNGSAGTQIGVLRNDGAGNLANLQYFNTAGAGQWGLGASDQDGDGDLDLVASSWYLTNSTAKTGNGYISIMENTSTSTALSFTLKKAITLSNTTEIVGLAVTDLDGDGLADDFAVADMGNTETGTGNKIHIYRNKRNLSTPAHVWLGYDD